MVPRTPRRSIALLAFVGLATAFFLWAQLGVGIDIENRSLKSVGTEEERAYSSRVRAFGNDGSVVLAFLAEPPSRAALTEEESDAIADLAEEIGRIVGVRTVEAVPTRSPGARALVVELTEGTARSVATIEAVRELATRRAPRTLRVAVSGIDAGEVVIARAVQDEQRTIVPIVVGGLLVLLLGFYRHPGLVAAVLAPAGAGLAWTGGLFALLGRQLDPVSVMLAPVLLTVGVASGVHFVEGFLDARAEGRKSWDAAAGSMERLLFPSALASLTTVVGFLSLAINTIPAVRDFGIFAALGVGLTYAIAVVTTPAILGLFAGRVPRALLARRGEASGVFAERAADAIARHSRTVLVVAAVVAAGSLALWPRLEIDNDPLRLLPNQHPFRRDTEAVASVLGASESFDVLVPAASSFANPASLALFGAAIVEDPLVPGPAGPALRAPSGDWLLRGALAPSGSHAREGLFDRIEARARAFGAPEVRATGTSVRIARDSGALVRGQILGTASSLLVLFLIFWLGFRSFRYAGLAMIPNVFPCLVIYGALAALGRPLSVATAMISSVLLGLIVDDTIHVLHSVRGERAGGATELAAVEHVFRHSARAIGTTTAVLAGGFALGMLGTLNTTVEFGALAAATVLVAFLSDLVLVPALLARRARAGGAHG